MEVASRAVLADWDAALIERARNGDQQAFAALIEPRAERALRTARAIIGEEARPMTRRRTRSFLRG